MPVGFPTGAGCNSANTIPFEAVVLTGAPEGVALALWLFNCPAVSTTAALAISEMNTSPVSVVLGVIETDVTPAAIPLAYQISFQAPLPLRVLTECTPGTWKYALLPPEELSVMPDMIGAVPALL